MRILSLNFYFEPDLSAGSFKNSALVRELGQQLSDDDRVDVITTLPNRYASFSAEAPEHEVQGNIQIHRVALPGHQSGMLDQSRAFATYAAAVLKMARRNRYDLVYASSSRLMMSVLGAWIARQQGSRLYLDIRDLFVDTIKDVLPGWIARPSRPVFSLMERWAVRQAHRVNIVSDGFQPYFRKWFPDTRLSHFTNGIDEEFLEAAPRESHRIESKVPEVIYAGNMGEGQGLHHIVPELATRFEGKLFFRLIGGGGRRDQLKRRLEEIGCENVALEDPVPRAELVRKYHDADILFLHLNDFEAFEKVLPSKIFEYAALGKPVWAGVAGFSAEFLRTHVDNVAVFPPCDVEAAVRTFQNLAMEVQRRQSFIESFARRRILDEMARDVIQTAS